MSKSGAGYLSSISKQGDAPRINSNSRPEACLNQIMAITDVEPTVTMLQTQFALQRMSQVSQQQAYA